MPWNSLSNPTLFLPFNIVINLMITFNEEFTSLFEVWLMLNDMFFSRISIYISYEKQEQSMKSAIHLNLSFQMKFNVKTVYVA